MPRRRTVRTLAARVTLLLACALALACGGKREEPAGTHPVAQIHDLSTSVAELSRDFDAHAGEARFVMLLSPT